MNSEELWKELIARAGRLADLAGVQRLLSWDQETMMPAGGVEARSAQLGTLSAVIHERYTDPALGDLLSRLTEALPPFAADAAGRAAIGAGATVDDLSMAPALRSAVVRAMGREYEKRSKLPGDLVVRIAELGARAKAAWKEARKADDFAVFRPYLEQQFALARESADHLGWEEDPYDALLDSYEPGLTYSWIDERFSALRGSLTDLTRQIQTAARGSSAHERAFAASRRIVPAERQLAFGRHMATELGYDFAHGRLDISAHPFTGGSAATDVRITTRVMEDYFPSCLMSIIHEAGHGIHGQQLAPVLRRIPIRYGLAVAESQSRFYENVLARSRGFWNRYFDELVTDVPELADLDRETWYHSLNIVAPSLIRVEADEVTYGLHIMLRFELEHEVINGRLAPADLPEAWNEGMDRYLGIRPTSDADGVLQDIHWSMGAVGYFPDYLLGSMLSAQLMQAAQEGIPDLDRRLESGDFTAINRFLAEGVQRHGGTMTFAELARFATGREFSAEPYLHYLRQKFSDLYGIDNS